MQKNDRKVITNKSKLYETKLVTSLKQKLYFNMAKCNEINVGHTQDEILHSGNQ